MCPPSDDSPTTIRITLEDHPPELPPGSVLEIDLLGTGASGLYAQLLASSAGGDNASVIAAAVLLENCIERLDEATDRRANPACPEAWLSTII